jgi:uncharacterized protein (TIGR03083 family)
VRLPTAGDPTLERTSTTGRDATQRDEVETQQAPTATGSGPTPWVLSSCPERADLVDGIELATAERTDLADFLATLTPHQWAAPSLCERWRVRDVVAHVTSFDGTSLLGMFRRVVRGRIVHANQVAVDELASLSTEELLHRLRAQLRPQGLATILGGRLALLDVTIHHQDIRRPLGMPREIPVERLRCVLGDSLRSPELPGWHLARGVRLAPTDLDWRHGRGPEVTGPAEAMLMAIAGRRSAIEELGGPGRQVVARRLARR